MLNPISFHPSWKPVSCLERGQIYIQGNVRDFIRMTGWEGGRVLYFGDHVFSDLAVSQDRLCVCISACLLVSLHFGVHCSSSSGSHHAAGLENWCHHSRAAGDLLPPSTLSCFPFFPWPLSPPSLLPPPSPLSLPSPSPCPSLSLPFSSPHLSFSPHCSLIQTFLPSPHSHVYYSQTEMSKANSIEAKQCLAEMLALESVLKDYQVYKIPYSTCVVSPPLPFPLCVLTTFTCVVEASTVHLYSLT